MARMTKFLKSVFHIVLFMLISYILNQKPIKPTKKVRRFLTDIKHLLLWTKFAGLEQEGQHIFINRNCDNLNCYVTTNRSLFGDLRYFDAIIFNVEDVARQSSDLPKKRSHIQKYIFAANDSADNFPVCSPVYDRFFNWTWSYRLDSSIPYKYITVHNEHNQEVRHSVQWISDMKPINSLKKSLLESKSKAAAIFLDKCTSTSGREFFLKKLQHELSKYNLTVDVFGDCGTLKCGRRNRNSCFYRLKTIYYFYLALEDSIAIDFVTDTVLNGYKHSAVPIVLGGAQYNRFLPPMSYLDATLLGEVELAKTMYEIIHNKEWYYEFFQWTNHYTIKESQGMNVCLLCEAMNNPAWLQVNATYVAFRRWWNPAFEERCDYTNTYFQL